MSLGCFWDHLMWLLLYCIEVASKPSTCYSHLSRHKCASLKKWCNIEQKSGVNQNSGNKKDLK
jgi:hypothetical protein